MESGCLLSKKEIIEYIFRNRLHLEKREACTYYLRKNTYVRNYKNLHRNNKYFQTKLVVTSGEEGERDKEEYPTSSNCIYILFLKLRGRNTETSYTFFLRTHQQLYQKRKAMDHLI